MELRPRPLVRPRPETGATLVEFALVAPVLFLLLFGLISGCFLVYQDAALHNGATAGARSASIESPLENSSFCEPSSPSSIIAAVTHAVPLLTVNPAQLCANPPNATTTTLTQTTVPGDVNVTVTCYDGSDTDTPAPCSGTVANVGVTLDLTTQGLVAPFGLNYHMQATSVDPEPILSTG
jgi:Flp pilus assembly protein TadG